MAKKSGTRQDWHRQDIRAALCKLYGTLTVFASAHGISKSCVSNALARPQPMVEAMIAKALGTTAPEIWPSRYTPDILANRHRHWRRIRNMDCNAIDPHEIVKKALKG